MKKVTKTKERLKQVVANAKLAGDGPYQSVQSIIELHYDADELRWIAENLSQHSNPMGKEVATKLYTYLLETSGIVDFSASDFEYQLDLCESIASESGLNDPDWSIRVLESLLQNTSDVLEVCWLAECAMRIGHHGESIAKLAYEKAKSNTGYAFEKVTIADSMWASSGVEELLQVNKLLEMAISVGKVECYGSLIEIASSLYRSKIPSAQSYAAAALDWATSMVMKEKDGGLHLIIDYMWEYYNGVDERIMTYLGSRPFPFGYAENLPVRITIVAFTEESYSHLKSAFILFPEVVITHGDILKIASNCVVSPANSTGKMDGGLDAQYRQYFGAQIERKLLERISILPDPGLNIGTTLIQETKHTTIPWLLVAPTVGEPGFTEHANVGRSMYAILKRLASEPQLQPCYCPLLGAGVGGVPVKVAAEQMASAYRDWVIKYIRENYVEHVILHI